MKNFTLTISILLFIFSNSFAYEFLHIVHPEQWGWTEPGSIHSASMLVEPSGLYANCALIIDFETGNAYQDPGENLEVEMGFSLPTGTQVTDLFLWIEDKPVQAFIFDTWTANLIYESIVQRRVDPAILVKTGPNNFNLKVYPITKQFPRRVRINFITPINNVVGDIQSVSLPMNILNLSEIEPDKFKVAFKGGEAFESPAIMEDSSLIFEQSDDDSFGDCEQVTIDSHKLTGSGTLLFSKKNSSKNFHLATFKPAKSEEKYFELALDYSELINIGNHKKTVFMIDFVDANCSYYDREELLETLKHSIKNSFSAKDSFNILISGFSTYLLSESWVSGNPLYIDAYLDNITKAQIQNFSNLPGLLLDGMNFIRENSNSGSLVLVSSSNTDGGHKQANSLIRGAVEYMGSEKLPVYIIDLDNQNYNYSQRHYIAGQYFMGNEYLYSRLSSLTGGGHYSLRNDGLISMLEIVTGNISDYMKSLEVFIQTDGGYTFSNYRLNKRGNFFYRSDGLDMIGKYIGEPPFQITIFGQSSTDEVFSFNKTITAEEIIDGSKCIQSAWSANYMQELMGMEQNNQIVGHIINTSISKRILSSYTAFLVLEPGFDIPDIDELDEFENIEVMDGGGFPINGIEDGKVANLSMSLANYPNPFATNTTISYSIPEYSAITISVYNATGQLVEILMDKKQESGKYTIDLDASQYEKGIYFCMLEINGTIMEKLKLVVI